MTVVFLMDAVKTTSRSFHRIIAGRLRGRPVQFISQSTHQRPVQITGLGLGEWLQRCAVRSIGVRAQLSEGASHDTEVDSADEIWMVMAASSRGQRRSLSTARRASGLGANPSPSSRVTTSLRDDNAVGAIVGSVPRPVRGLDTGDRRTSSQPQILPASMESARVSFGRCAQPTRRPDRHPRGRRMLSWLPAWPRRARRGARCPARLPPDHLAPLTPGHRCRKLS